MRPTPLMQTALQAAVFALATTVVPAQRGKTPAELPTNTALAKAIVAEELETDAKRALESYGLIWDSEQAPIGVRRHAAMRFALLGRASGTDAQRIEDARAFALGGGPDDPVAQRMGKAWQTDQRSTELDRMVEDIRKLVRDQGWEPVRTMGLSAIPALLRLEYTTSYGNPASTLEPLQIVWRTPGPLAAAAIDAGLRSDRQARWALALEFNPENAHPEHHQRIAAVLSDPEAEAITRYCAMTVLGRDQSGRRWPLEPVIALLDRPEIATLGPLFRGSSPLGPGASSITLGATAAQFLVNLAQTSDAKAVLAGLLPVLGTPVWSEPHEELLLKLGLATVAGRAALFDRVPEILNSGRRDREMTFPLELAEPATPEEHARMAALLRSVSRAKGFLGTFARWYLFDMSPDDAEILLETPRLRIGVGVALIRRAAVLVDEDQLRPIAEAFIDDERNDWTFLRETANRKSLPENLWPLVRRGLETGTLKGGYIVAEFLQHFDSDEAIGFICDEVQKGRLASIEFPLFGLALRHPEDARVQSALSTIWHRGKHDRALFYAGLAGIPLRAGEGFETSARSYMIGSTLVGRVPNSWVDGLPEERRGDLALRWSSDEVRDLLISVSEKGGQSPLTIVFRQDSTKSLSMTDAVRDGVQAYFTEYEERVRRGDTLFTELIWSSFQYPKLIPEIFREQVLSLVFVTLQEGPVDSSLFNRSASFLRDAVSGWPTRAARIREFVVSLEAKPKRAIRVYIEVLGESGSTTPWELTEELWAKIEPYLSSVTDNSQYGKQWSLYRMATSLPTVEARLGALGAILDQCTNTEAKKAACEDLARTGRNEAAEPLINALFDRSLPVQNAARDALELLRVARTERAHWERVRSGAIELDPAAATQKLFADLENSDDSEDRVLILRSLGAVAPPTALPQLIELRKSEAMAAQRSTIDAAIEQILARAKTN